MARLVPQNRNIQVTLGLNLSGSGASAKSAIVPSSVSGPIYTIARALGSTSTLALMSGTSGNITLSGATLSLTAGLGAGVSQTALIRESKGNLAVEYPLILTGAAAATAPDAPTIGAVTAGNAQNSVSFTDNADNGSAITGHKVERQASGGSFSTIAANYAGASPYVDAGLTNGTTYGYRVSAINAVGTSPASAVASGTPSAGASTLNALTVSNGAATIGVAYTGTVSGKTAGSTLSLSGAGSAGLSVSGTTISGTATTAGAVNVIETLSGATNTPRTTSGLITVASASITLAALTVSNGSANVGTAYSATVSGKTAGSALSLTGAGAAGLSISGTTISGTPTTAGAINIVETLAGATNTPRTTSGLVTVSDMPAGLFAQWSIDSLGALNNNDDVNTWTDSVGGVVLTSPVSRKPAYKTNIKGSKPGLLFSGDQLIEGATGTPLGNVLGSGNMTVYVVMSGALSPNEGNASVVSTLSGVDGSGVAMRAAATGYGRVGETWNAPYQNDDFMTLAMSGVAPPPIQVGGNGGGSGISRYALNGGYFHQTNNSIDMRATHGAIGIGGRPTAGNGNLNFKGYVHEVLIFNRELTQTELLRLQVLFCGKYAQPTPWAAKAAMYLFAGDSLTVGVNVDVSASYPYLIAQAKGLKYGQWSNQGISGTEPTGLNSLATTDIDTVTAVTGKPTLAIYGEYYNSADTAIAKNTTWLTNRKTAGVKNVFWTSVDTPTTDQASRRPAYNAYWDNSANRAGLIDGYAAVHTNANIGVVGCNTGSNPNFIDYTHLTEAGNAVLAPLINAAITAAGY